MLNPEERRTMNTQILPLKINLDGFCKAYRSYLGREGRSEFEQPEPDPETYGMPSVIEAGERREHPLAESLRRQVYAEFSADVINRVKERKAA